MCVLELFMRVSDMEQKLQRRGDAEEATPMLRAGLCYAQVAKHQKQLRQLDGPWAASRRAATRQAGSIQAAAGQAATRQPPQ